MNRVSAKARPDYPAPLKLARDALARGRSVGADLEIYVQYGRTVHIKVFRREVESVTVAEPRGLGIRAVRDGRMGYSFTADLSNAGVDLALAAAADNLRAADVDPFVHLPEPVSAGYLELPGLWLPGIAGTDLAAKTRIALEAEAAALANPAVELVEESVYADEEAWVGIASSTGIEAEAEQSLCFTYVMALAGGNDERQSGLGFSTGRDPAALDPEQTGREAADKARALLGARPCATGAYTVVFDREVAAALIASIAQALSADAVQKGRSVFAGKVGQTVASRVLTVLDDGLAAGGMATNPFDGEGVSQQATPLFEAGVLRSFLHSSYTARKEGEGVGSTGNAARASYRSVPGVGATNLVVVPGEGDLVDVTARVGEGLYVDSVAGLHSGLNPISGEISVGATGRLIAGGALGAPVREVTIATDFAGFLGSVSDLGGDARWIPLHGSVCAPSLVVDGIAVSGV
jgi:PmbA protein